MKRILLYIVALLMLITPMAACKDEASVSGQPDTSEQPAPSPPAPLDPPQPSPPPLPSPPPEGSAQDLDEPPDDSAENHESPPYDAIIEYGAPDIIKVNDGPLYTYIRFPQAGYETDAAISDWALGIYGSAKAEFEEILKTDSSAAGEINIHFDSWLVDERFVGILEKGSFTHSHMARPRDIVNTFNIDLSLGEFLDNDHIIDPAQHEKVLSLLRERILEQSPDANELLSELDERCLSKLVISNDGIVVMLESYAFLPGSFGTVAVTLPYEDLGAALVLGAEPKPAPPPAPSPTPAPPPPPPRPIPIVPPQTGDIDPLLPMVALSFDDGPSKHTEQVLDLLEQYGARATFFTVGKLVNAYSDTIERAVSIGCEVAGHSWNHKNLTTLTDEEIIDEIMGTSLAIEEITGAALPFFRPPYGSVDDNLKYIAGELGFAMINWSVDPKDWKSRNEDLICTAIMDRVRDGSIILCHDIYSTTADAMMWVIPELIAEGYQLVTVSELLYYRHGELETGKVYNRG